MKTNKDKIQGKGRSVADSIGYFGNNANSIYDNANFVYLQSECSSRSQGLSIIPSNFRKVCALFTARKTIKRNWANQKDEYMKPNQIDVDAYEQWVNDGIIYSLFNTSSNQSSLRDITYKDKKWDIQNEWFWMSPDIMRDLAIKHNNQAVLADYEFCGAERYVYVTLQGMELSMEAQWILDRATILVHESFKYREIMNKEHPEFHLNSWDAGWYQIVKILKKYMPEDLKAFREKYKKFEDLMRPGVYKFGFLRGGVKESKNGTMSSNK